MKKKKGWKLRRIYLSTVPGMFHRGQVSKQKKISVGVDLAVTPNKTAKVTERSEAMNSKDWTLELDFVRN